MTGVHRRTRAGQGFALAMALVASLFAAGVPVLHAMAHELAEVHHPAEALTTGSELEHGHDEVHPASLHDEQLLIKRHSLDLSFTVPAPAKELTTFVAPATIQHRPAVRLASRAPPSSDLPRGPPLA